MNVFQRGDFKLHPQQMFKMNTKNINKRLGSIHQFITNTNDTLIFSVGWFYFVSVSAKHKNKDL